MMPPAFWVSMAAEFELPNVVLLARREPLSAE